VLYRADKCRGKIPRLLDCAVIDDIAIAIWSVAAHPGNAIDTTESWILSLRIRDGSYEYRIRRTPRWTAGNVPIFHNAHIASHAYIAAH
jgi:hypothetical protein